MKVARVNTRRTPILSSPFGVGGGNAMPSFEDLTDVDMSGVADGDVPTWDAGTSTWLPGTGSTPTTMWVPVMVEDGATGLWYVTVTGDGDAVMTEVPL